VEGDNQFLSLRRTAAQLPKKKLTLFSAGPESDMILLCLLAHIKASTPAGIKESEKE